MSEPKSTLITDIPEEELEKRGWKVSVNGKPIINVSRVTISNPRFGEFNYGMTRGKYDGWSFHEIGGGGSVIIPYVHINDSIFVGLIKQERHNQGGKVWNVPRGFLEPGETHFQAGLREADEEMVGVMLKNIQLTVLPGAPMNPNSAFFETPAPNEGVQVFALKIPPGLLRPRISTHGKESYGFANQILKPAPHSVRADMALAEKILDCEFVSWQSATAVGDMFTVAAVARLLAHLGGHHK